ncbi:uncharacterized protein [Diabrotica undecimpunctata]|uniref:uncharacterized protein n=1 Tax=Diabrotica undecimpunctata TaxID=50387 RepID=UPI003B6337E3
MPKQLNSRSKELVASLVNYFEEERNNNGPLLPLNAVQERVAAALKISVRTVSTICQMQKKGEQFESPKKKRCTNKRVTNTTTLNTSSIRDTIYNMYQRKQHVTVQSLWSQLKDKELFNGSTTSLKRLLKELGFEWMKDNPRRGLMELPNVVCKRVQFLRTYKEAKDEGIYQFVFLDETWIFQNGIIGHSWQNENIKSVKTTKTDGKRYIILHAGNETGFVEGKFLEMV